MQIMSFCLKTYKQNSVFHTDEPTKSNKIKIRNPNTGKIASFLYFITIKSYSYRLNHIYIFLKII